MLSTEELSEVRLLTVGGGELKAAVGAIVSFVKVVEVMGEDEYLEVTPKSVRLRKKYLTELDRVRANRNRG